MATDTHTVSSLWQEQLEVLLGETIGSAHERARTAFFRSPGASLERLVLFGAGSMGRRVLAELRTRGVEPLCFADSNRTRWGQQIEGVEILGPAQALKHFGSEVTFLITIWSGTGTDGMADRVAQLKALGGRTVVPFLPFFWMFPESLLPFYAVDLPEKILAQAEHIRTAFSLLADEPSQREFIAQLRFRLLGDFLSLSKPVTGSFYFRNELFRLGANESLVDCGAFDGDTIRDFLRVVDNRFQSVLAFEPDPDNFATLTAYLTQLPGFLRTKMRLLPSATADRRGKVRMEIGAGTCSAVGAGNFEVDCLTLDQALDGAPVSFLKMDIEGSESVTLAGGAESIRRHRPILALSAYHRQNDLWELPLQVAAMMPDCSFYLQPHFLDGWELVSYALPAHRRIRP